MRWCFVFSRKHLQSANEVETVIWVSYLSERTTRDPRGDWPKRRSFGHRQDPSSGDVECLPIGLSLTRLAASKNIFCNSEKVITLSPTATVIAFFTDFTRAFEVLFCRGASARRNFHSIILSRTECGQLIPIHFLFRLERRDGKTLSTLTRCK